MSEVLTCAECGYTIEKGEEYYEVKDNFLRANYFDSNEDAIFCSPTCVLRNISCDHEVFGGEK